MPQRPRPNEDRVRDQLAEERERVPHSDHPVESAAASEASDVSRPDAGEGDPRNEAEHLPETEAAKAESPADENPLARAERERGEYLELAQRTQAEFENYRKRAAKESAAAGERAKAGLVRELLPVVDNLERALQSAGESEQHLAEGVKLVHSELVALLERNGVESFDPRGESFDPTEHEALSTRPADGAEPGKVLDVAEKGYKLNGTVLRPARVVVSA